MSATRRENARLAAAEELRYTRRRSMLQMRRDLELEDIPLCGSYDRLGPELVRACVYWYARTGDWDLVSDETGLQRIEVRRCLTRAAAREIIDFMLEEGTWPEGAPTGGRVRNAS